MANTERVKKIKKLKKLKIGKKTYLIKEVRNVDEAAYHLGFSGVSKPRRNKKKQCDGMVDFDQEIILINRNLKPAVRDSTLFHELLHIVAPFLGEEAILDLEENIFPVLNEYGFRFCRKPNGGK